MSSAAMARSRWARTSNGSGPVNTRLPLRSAHLLILSLLRACTARLTSIVFDQNDCIGWRLTRALKPLKRLVSVASSWKRMSLACDQADELATPRAEMTANAVSARLSMAFLPPNGSLVDGRSGHPSGPAVDTCRCGADRLDDEGDCLRESRGTIRQLHELGKDQNAARPRAQLGSGIWPAAASRI